MEFILLVVIILQFAYIVYKDFLFNTERESLYLKIMSKDLAEYREITKDGPEDEPREEEDIIIPIEEATVEQVLKATDIT